MLPANWLTEVIKVAAFAAVALSFYFVFWPRIRIILGKEEDSGLRRLDLKAGYEESITDTASHAGMHLRHIKAAWQGDELICLFVNDGDSVLNIQIEAELDCVGTVVPCDYLKSGETGSIRLQFPTSSRADDVPFSIRYEDERGYVHRTRYLIEAESQTLRRQEDNA